MSTPYRLLDRGETMQEGDEVLANAKDEKWEPIAHWSVGMPYRSSNNPVRRALDVRLGAEGVIERLQARVEHSAYFYGVRFARLWHWAHEELDERLKSRFFSIVANGTADEMEQPTYAQQMNRLRHRAELAEEELAKLRDAAGVGELPAGHWRCACGAMLKGGATHMNCPAGNGGVDVPAEAQPVSREVEHAIDTALDLHPISIRLPKALIERYKAVAAERGLIYQPLMRQALAEWIATGVAIPQGGKHG